MFAGVQFGTVGKGAGRRRDGGLFRQAFGFRLGFGLGSWIWFWIWFELGFVGSGRAGILRVD